MNPESSVPGTWEMNREADAVMDFLAAIFDPADGRFTWKDCLPSAYDSVWAWKDSGKTVSALITRPVKTADGARGIAIGMVGTRVERRGQGFASALVNAAAQYTKTDGGSFAVLWTRERLIPFYEALGFKDIRGEDNCAVLPTPDGPGPDGTLTFREFGDLSHEGLDALRLEFDRGQAEEGGGVLRQLRHKKWHGISGSRDGQFGILFGGTEEYPEFYSVVTYGTRAPVILEFVGGPENFQKTVSWITAELGPKPISYSLTAPHLDRVLDSVQVVSRETTFHTLVRPLGGTLPKAPIMTWLDRI